MKNPIVHIGYHKTATSFLQKEVFEANPDMFYRVPQREIYNLIISPNYFEFRSNFKNIKDQISFYLRIAEERNLVPVFSNERLSGGPHTGGHDSAEIAFRIHELMPESLVFMVIREQNSMIHSCYNQYVKAIGSCGLTEYLNPSTNANKFLFRKDFFFYHLLIDHYSTLFTKNQFLCLPKELLDSDSPEFFRTMLLFFGVEMTIIDSLIKNTDRVRTNVSLSPLEISVKKYFNPIILVGHKNLGTTFNSKILNLVYTVLIQPVRLFKFSTLNNMIKRKRKRKIQSFVNESYIKSNSITSKVIGIDLSKFGYRIS